MTSLQRAQTTNQSRVSYRQRRRRGRVNCWQHVPICCWSDTLARIKYSQTQVNNNSPTSLRVACLHCIRPITSDNDCTALVMWYNVRQQLCCNNKNNSSARHRSRTGTHDVTNINYNSMYMLANLNAWTKIVPAKSFKLTKAFRTAMLKSCLQQHQNK